MLKFLQNRDEVIDLLHTIAEVPELQPFKIGVAGSYADGTNKKSSSIDIVLKLKEGEDPALIGAYHLVEKIRNVTCNVYSNKLQVIWLDLLEKDEEELIEFSRMNGIEANPESAYTNIVECLRWLDDDSDISDEDDDDRISNAVMTWDDEDDFDNSMEVDE